MISVGVPCVNCEPFLHPDTNHARYAPYRCQIAGCKCQGLKIKEVREIEKTKLGNDTR